MCDVWLGEDMIDLLSGKYVLILGGSIMRGLYKDMVWLLNTDSTLPREVLGTKAEPNFPDFVKAQSRRDSQPVELEIQSLFKEGNRDVLLESNGLHAGRNYIEPRFYCSTKHDINIYFVFITKIWSQYLQDWLDEHKKDIDVVIVNSGIWDVNRWGPFSHQDFKNNLKLFCNYFKDNFNPDNFRLIWINSLPVARKLKSKGMSIQGRSCTDISTRYMILEANFYSAHFVAECGYDVLDAYYYFSLMGQERNRDGVHWSPKAMRLLTCLVLSHLALRNESLLPRRLYLSNQCLHKAKLRALKSMVTSEHFITNLNRRMEGTNKYIDRINFAKDDFPSIGELKAEASKIKDFKPIYDPNPAKRMRYELPNYDCRPYRPYLCHEPHQPNISYSPYQPVFSTFSPPRPVQRFSRPPNPRFISPWCSSPLWMP